jgi:hypothetical protein
MFRCEGDLAQTCTPEDGTEFYDWRTDADCASQGQVCREGSTHAECVYADRPCSASTCTAGEAINCGASRFVTGTEICEADATCEVGSQGAACVYTQATCSSDIDEFCAADGVTLYGGCEAGFGAATRRFVCYGSSPACVQLTEGRAICGS